MYTLNPRSTRLSRFRETPEEERLAAVSEQLVRDIKTVLARVLLLKPGDNTSTLLNSVPVLTLHFFPVNSNRVLTDAERPSLLRAFALLAVHSQRLGAFPELKKAFWMDVLSSSMMVDTTRGVHKCMLKRPEFPRFVLDFSSFRHTDAVLTEELADVLFAFMTTPIANTYAPDVSVNQVDSPNAVQPSSTIGFGLSFARSKLNARSLNTLLQFFSRVFAHPDRQFSIDMLDLSDHMMNAAELAVVADIVENIKTFKIRELKLDKIIPGSMTSDWRAPAATPNEFLRIVKCLMNGRFPPVQTEQDHSPPSTLHLISMRGNYFCPKFFAALYSTLRYGCPVEQDLSSYQAKRYPQVSEKKRVYWRWLAFGLFYPRPKRFASAFHLRQLGELYFNTEAMATIEKTLQNPVAELVYNGEPGENNTEVTELQVCTLKSGSKIDVFEPGSELTSSIIANERCVLEALCEKEDGSVCVVVPGIGLGWVHRKFVERMEREALEPRRADLDGQYELTLIEGAYYDDPRCAFRTFIKLLGRQLSTVRCRVAESGTDTMQFILDHCIFVRHLDLDSRIFKRDDTHVLLIALAGELGNRLLSLNLNKHDSVVNDEFVQNLSALLSRTKNPLALQELRLCQNRMTAKGIRSLMGALRDNRSLVLLELTKSHFREKFNGRDEYPARKQLEAAYQGQPLLSEFALECKLAVLSVVSGKHTAPESACQRLDMTQISLIFQFAAKPKVHRMIAWDGEIRCALYP